ncbi:MAG: hypothetical protein ACRCUS_02860, partial [Anaerovoracaceae bacterium]
MAISTASIYPLLRPGVKAVIGNYDTYPDQWKAVFTTHTSDKKMEFEDEFKSLGMAQIKAEGTSVAQDTMTVRYQTTYLHTTYGLSFSITEEAMRDNLYASQFPQHLLALRNSLRAAKSQAAANVFNLGATTQLTADGVPFFSANHPLDNGADVSNLSNVALSEVGIQNAIIGIQQFKQLSGILTNTMPKKLLVGPANQFAASIILGSQFRTSVGSGGNGQGTNYAGVNDINAIYNDSYLPGGYVVNNYITSPTFSAIITDAERGLIHYERDTLEPWNWMDNTTRDMWFAAK